MVDEEDKINRQRAINGIKSDIDRLTREIEAAKNQVAGLRRAQDILEDQKETK